MQLLYEATLIYGLVFKVIMHNSNYYIAKDMKRA